MKLILASRNTGKVSELIHLLADLPFAIESLNDHPEVGEVEECGTSYAENALLKANAAASATGLPALADDSGLEVDALGGRPGVRSARYSGGGSDENTRLLLRELKNVLRGERTARFRCIVALVWPEGRALLAEGTCEGIIADKPRGRRGFGYDPVFIDPSSEMTFAELDAEHKHRISHRARACAALVQLFRAAQQQAVR